MFQMSVRPCAMCGSWFSGLVETTERKLPVFFRESTTESVPVENQPDFLLIEVDMIILGIETSCDETSAAVLAGDVLKSNVISTQLVHTLYGGVVPELASRAHLRLIVPVVKEALRVAGVGKKNITGVAVTYGPGLMGALSRN